LKNKLYSLLILLVTLSRGCRHKTDKIKSLAQLSGGKTFAVPTETAADQFVLKQFPDAKMAYYNKILAKTASAFISLIHGTDGSLL
jgi:hypothetical protein